MNYEIAIIMVDTYNIDGRDPNPSAWYKLSTRSPPQNCTTKCSREENIGNIGRDL